MTKKIGVRHYITKLMTKVGLCQQIKQEEELWTPNQALAALRKCNPADCRWVWEPKEYGNKKMSKYAAFVEAREMNRDL